MPDRPRERVFVGLGSNIDAGGRNRAQTLDGALAAIGEVGGTRVVAVSSVRETAPVGPVPQGPYLNAVAELGTDLEPEALLEALLGIERAFGRDREREERWGPRTLDLDVLLYGLRQVRTFDLEVPHPRMCERRFVLEPLAEIAPEVIVAGTGASVSAWLATVMDQEAGG